MFKRWSKWRHTKNGGSLFLKGLLLLQFFSLNRQIVLTTYFKLFIIFLKKFNLIDIIKWIICITICSTLSHCSNDVFIVMLHRWLNFRHLLVQEPLNQEKRHNLYTSSYNKYISLHFTLLLYTRAFAVERMNWPVHATQSGESEYARPGRMDSWVGFVWRCNRLGEVRLGDDIRIARQFGGHGTGFWTQLRFKNRSLPASPVIRQRHSRFRHVAKLIIKRGKIHSFID